MFTQRKYEVIICLKLKERIQNQKKLFVNSFFLKDLDIEKTIKDCQENQMLFCQNIEQ